MSIYDKASLVLIPSGTKTSKVYSQKPVSGDGDFTFSRSTAATRVYAEGVIEKETQNLLLQSNGFDTSANWVNTSSSETSGHTGYDGSSDAWLLTKSGAGGRLHQNITASGVLTYSVYMKANDSTWGLIQMNGSGADKYVYVNLSTGAKGAVGGGNITEKIEDVGNGWYRISVTASTDATRVRIYPAEENTAGGTSGSVYIQDAQLEQGLVARDYIETTTTAVEGGITDNVPRLDYTDASCPSLLLEPQRTNVIESSEYFDGSLWSATNITITNNDTESPEGIDNASKIVLDSGSSSSCELRAQNNKSVTLGDDYTFSVFAKADEFDKIELDFSDSRMGSTYVVANLTNGTITLRGNDNTSDSIEDYGDGWYRIILTGTAIATGTTALIFRLGANPTGDGTSGFHIYGAQFEEGSYATSYIPTYGSAVTRNAETCLDAGNADTFNDSEGVFYTEISTLSLSDTSERRITISNTSNNSYLRIQYGGTSGTIYLFVYINGVKVADIRASLLDTTNKHKVAIRYGSAGYSGFVDGVLVETDTYAGNFVSYPLNSLDFYQWKGNVKQLLYIPTALTDQEMIDLTTID